MNDYTNETWFDNNSNPIADHNIYIYITTSRNLLKNNSIFAIDLSEGNKKMKKLLWKGRGKR